MFQAEFVRLREGIVCPSVFFFRTVASAVSCEVISGPGIRVLNNWMYLFESIICRLIL